MYIHALDKPSITVSPLCFPRFLPLEDESNKRILETSCNDTFYAIHAHRSANGRMSLPDNDNDLTRAKLST